MTKLTDTQTIILTAGAQRPDNLAMPLPKGLAGAAAKMAVSKMIEHGWLQEVEVIRHWKEKAQEAGSADTWRQTVVFCSTVAHAAHVTEAFNAADVPAALIHCDLPSDVKQRAKVTS